MCIRDRCALRVAESALIVATGKSGPGVGTEKAWAHCEAVSYTHLMSNLEELTGRTVLDRSLSNRIRLASFISASCLTSSALPLSLIHIYSGGHLVYVSHTF